MRLETGENGQETRDRRWETGDNRRYEMGDRRLETPGDGRQDT